MTQTGQPVDFGAPQSHDDTSRLMEFTIDRAPDSVFWIAIDGRLVHVNQAACNSLGYTRDELQAMRVCEIDPNFPHEAWPAQWRMLEEKGSLRFETVHRRKDGTTFPVEIHASTLQHEGRTYHVAFARNLSQARTAAEMLKEARHFIEAALDAIPDPIVVIDLEHRVILANRAACRSVGGVDPVAAGMKCYQVSHKRDIPCAGVDEGCPLQQVLDQKSTVVVRHDHHNIQGRHRIVETTAAPILDDRGEVVRIIEVCRDITATVEAQEALSRSNEDLDQFANIVSHDLQEPLRQVEDFARLLQDKLGGDLRDTAAEYMAFIQDGAVRMRRLIDDLLRYSRLTAGPTLEMTPADAALDRALVSLQLAVSESGARIERQPMPTVCADPTQLFRVFQNLIANAVKFRSQAPPVVQIGAREEGADWLFWVADNGIGIARDDVERVFTIFQRLHTRQKCPGAGIGLAICKKIIDRHGGRIWIDSELGKGSTFYFTIPK